MNKTNNPRANLIRLARQAPAPAPVELPFGFATRVVAHWSAAETPALSAVWEWLSVRSLVLAALIMATTLGANYDLMSPDWPPEIAMADTTFDSLLEP